MIPASCIVNFHVHRWACGWAMFACTLWLHDIFETTFSNERSWFPVLCASCASLCVCCRFQAGPKRRAGGAGPHLQPGQRPRPPQRQRQRRYRRPGHMKTTRSRSHTNTHSHSPRLSLLPLPPSLPRSIHPYLSFSLRHHGKKNQKGEHPAFTPTLIFLSLSPPPLPTHRNRK